MKKSKKIDINEPLVYFSQFLYPPTSSEVYIFLHDKCTFQECKQELVQLVEANKITIKNDRIIIPGINIKNYEQRELFSQNLHNKAFNWLRFLRYIPSIQYLGISGSLSMLNGEKGSDIDIFIITSKDTLWITRFLVLVYKKIVTMIRADTGSLLCFNLFISSSNLLMPHHKQNEYIAHEILQLKKVVGKNNIYSQFLFINKWINTFFPNVQIDIYKDKDTKNTFNTSFLLKFLEKIIGFIQKKWLHYKNIRWEESDGQLWLIQEDYEKKLK